MDPDLVLHKTAKGREEIEKRTHRVDAKRRTLLILIDGRATAAELAEKTAHIADAYTLLETLLAEGFVEPPGDALPSGSASRSVVPAAAAPAAATMPTQSLDELRRLACKQVERLMGPDGDSVALKLERAENMQDFVAQAQKTREILKAFLGPRKADEFWKVLGL